MSDRLVRTVQRSAPWWALGVVFLALSIPAVFDLKSLFTGLAVIAWVVAGTTAAFTFFDRRTA